MAKPKSNTGQLVKALSKKTGHYTIKENWRIAANNKYMDALFFDIETKHPEYCNTLGFIPYVPGYHAKNRQGILLRPGKLGIYDHLPQQKLFGKKTFEYELKEYDLQNLEFTKQEQTDAYRRPLYYEVNLLEKGNNLATFHIGKKLFQAFEEAFNQEKQKLL